MIEKTLKPGWKIWRFDQMAYEVKDRIDHPADSGLDLYVGLEHLDTNSLKIWRWGSTTDVEKQKLLFKSGDIIFGRRNAYLRRVAVADFDGVCSAHAMVLRAHEEIILPELLPFFMQTDIFWEAALKVSAGSMSPTINWSNLASQDFALPPLDEQTKILIILSAIENGLSSFRHAINKTNLLIKSIRNFEFDPARYKGTMLSKLCPDGGIQIGPFGAQLHKDDYVEVGIPVVMPINMIEDTINITNIARISEDKTFELFVHKIRAGDILLPRRGELDRRVIANSENEGWICGTGSLRIRLNKTVSSRAVFHSLASSHTVRWLNGNAVGTTMQNLNSKIVGRIPIALPPKSHQDEVVELLDEIISKRDTLRNRMKGLLTIKKKLTNVAFGET